MPKPHRNCKAPIESAHQVFSKVTTQLTLSSLVEGSAAFNKISRNLLTDRYDGSVIEEWIFTREAQRGTLSFHSNVSLIPARPSKCLEADQLILHKDSAEYLQ